jgi:NarL family two-component system response regulator LiaR
MSSTPIRILIVDDHAVVRRGLKALLGTEPDIEIVGEAEDGRQAIDMTARLEPDVVLMDLVMPEVSGVDATRQIVARHRKTRVLVLTSFGSDDKLFPAIKAGAQGYLLKDATPEELIRAIRGVLREQSTLTPSVARRLLRELSKDPDALSRLETLTARETEVLQLIARGMSNDALADRLCISEATARTHVSSILGKLNVTSRTQAALYALKHGLASLDDLDELPD